MTQEQDAVKIRAVIGDELERLLISMGVDPTYNVDVIVKARDRIISSLTRVTAVQKCTTCGTIESWKRTSTT